MQEVNPLIIKPEGPIHTLIINNPRKRNALGPAVFTGMISAMENILKDDDIRVLIIRGQGDKAFSAGADIGALPDRNGAPKGPTLRELREKASKLIRFFPYPVIAMINGDCLGAGCGLAMLCDIRIAASHARMGIPTSKMGLIAQAEGFKRFVLAIGYTRTIELFMRGHFYNSEQCLQMGLVNYVVDSDKLESFTYDMANEIAGNAPLSIKGSKYVINQIVEPHRLTPKDYEEFKIISQQAAKSDDHEEAKRAFKEKRKPMFKGC